MFGILLNSADLFCILPDINFFCILLDTTDLLCILLKIADICLHFAGNYWFLLSFAGKNGSLLPFAENCRRLFLHFAGNYGFFAFYWKLGISYLHFAEIIDIFSILLEITDLFCIFCILPESADLSNGWRRTWVQCIGAILAWRAPQKPLETQCDRLQHEKF